MKHSKNEYEKKRNFKFTSEPSFKRGKPGKKLIFVVQEHHASHLHYDFRLEWDGALKSWAVPKGPSMDPQEKRLAVQVEDHPIAYAKFTGKIPQGQYGAGDVYRWDYGSWTPDNNPTEGLRKGHLDFTLNGDKLHGRFMLIRTKRGGKRPNWLLIKRHDDFAEELPQSELEFIKPQLALLVDKPPTGTDWVHEIKFDGYRIQTHLNRGKIQMYTRSGLDWTGKYPELANDLKKLDVDGAIFDGEVVYLDESGRSDFQKLQNVMKAGKSAELVYYVFDLLALDGKSLQSLPLIARKDRLEKLMKKLKSKRIRFSEHFRVEGSELLHEACGRQLEGVVSKRVDTPYVPGRHSDWVKSKCLQRQEFVIGGYTEPQGARSGFGALLLGVYEGDDFRYVGRCGTGFTQASLKDLHRQLKSHSSDKSPFSSHGPRGRDLHWVKPTLVCEVAFSEWTSDKILRVPVFQGLRKDKPAQQIHIEKPTHVKGSKVTKAMATPSEDRAPSKAKLTHPDKIVYAAEKLTKRDVADYYAMVEKWLMPHVEGRPLALVKCPQGMKGGQCFFSKHEGHSKQPYIMIDSAEDLLQAVQNNTLEIHAWGCHEKTLEKPDQIVIDFDPDEGVPFAKVKAAAFELKAILDKLKLKSFVKVTGGKGLHVQFPFTPKHDWEHVKGFAKALAEEMASRHPEKYVATMSKAKRRGKIFIDYLRNGRGSTAIVPYALRARETSSVAMPLAWKDLKGLKAANSFTLEKAKAYLKRRKIDPWADYFEIEQNLELSK